MDTRRMLETIDVVRAEGKPPRQPSGQPSLQPPIQPFRQDPAELQNMMDVGRGQCKRDRPLSSYFGLPVDGLSSKLSDFFQHQGGEADVLDFSDNHNEKENENDENEDEQGAQGYVSPLMKRGPLRNLTNFVSNFEFPSVKKKISFSKKSLTRSRGPALKPAVPIPQHSPSLEDEENDQISPNQHQDRKMLASMSTNEMGSPTQTGHKDRASLRRFHSMCQTTKEKEVFSMQDNSHLNKTSIKHFKVDNDLLPRIDEDELYKIVCGEHDDAFDEYVVIDCRFNYEYEGGHIMNALNISSQQDLEEIFLKGDRFSSKKRRLLIFHCEFSVFRGPTLASHLRKCDRVVNSDNYPMLSYPDIVVLEGGYKTFFDKYRYKCIPQAYVEMKDVRHSTACESELDKVRQASKLPRTKSFNHFSANSGGNVHLRSNSFTTVTSHAENLKILKRQRSISRARMGASALTLDLKLTRASTFSYSLSIFNDSPTRTPKLQGSFEFDDDFQPPPSTFRLDNRTRSSSPHASKLSLSSNSINSSSICSDPAFEYSSTESLTDPYSSANDESSEFFDVSGSSQKSFKYQSHPYLMKQQCSKKLLLKPVARKPMAPVPQLPLQNGSISNWPSTSDSDSRPVLQNSFQLPNPTSFTFPEKSGLPHQSPRNITRGSSGLKSPQTITPLNLSTSTFVSHPVVSSPLSTATPISTTDVLGSGEFLNDEILVPLDSRGRLHSKTASSTSSFAGFSGLTGFLDIDEVEEDSDEDDTVID